MRYLGRKLMGFGSALGSKLKEGLASVGHKLYDNKYKIASLGLGLGAAAVAYNNKDTIQDIYRVRQEYSGLSSAAEREGFREQMGDMGIPRGVFFGLK